MNALEVAAHNMQHYGKLLEQRHGEAPVGEVLVAAQTYALIALAQAATAEAEAAVRTAYATERMLDSAEQVIDHLAQLTRMAAAMETTAQCQERIVALEETYHERLSLRERLKEKVQEAEQAQTTFTELINIIVSSDLAKK